jgi:hypothetical protein
MYWNLILVAAWSKVWVCGCSLVGVAVSNPARAVMSLPCDCCVSGTGPCVGLITRPEESFRVQCVWVSPWSLHNEEALAHWGCCAMGKICTETGPYLATEGRDYKNNHSHPHQITEELTVHSRIVTVNIKTTATDTCHTHSVSWVTVIINTVWHTTASIYSAHYTILLHKVVPIYYTFRLGQAIIRYMYKCQKHRCLIK